MQEAMLQPSARLLALLSLLQLREWTGQELAGRFEVEPRTIRRDIDKLRALGYPVHAARGVAGGYRLGAGARLPPLLLDDAEAVAVAVGLRAPSRVLRSPRFAHWASSNKSYPSDCGARSGHSGPPPRSSRWALLR